MLSKSQVRKIFRKLRKEGGSCECYSNGYQHALMLAENAINEKLDKMRGTLC
jgi:hypothetical protein